MDKTEFTVFFEEPFWIGVFERVERGKLSVCKVTFGAKPKDSEIWIFLLEHYHELKFSPAVKIENRQTADNPKRRQRNAAKQMKDTGIGTKSQQALQRQREELKTGRKQQSRDRKEAEKQRLFDLKQQKRKEKHRGR